MTPFFCVLWPDITFRGSRRCLWAVQIYGGVERGGESGGREGVGEGDGEMAPFFFYDGATPVDAVCRELEIVERHQITQVGAA